MIAPARLARLVLPPLVYVLCAAGFALQTTPLHAATASVSPASTTVVLSTAFTVDLVTDAFPDLKACELILTFDPNIVKLTGSTTGEVFTSTGEPYQDFLLPDYTSPPDSAWYDAAMLTGSAAGPGTLVHLQFLALAEGNTALIWRKADYRDSNNTPTQAATVNGVIHVIGPTAVRANTWGGLRRTYLPAPFSQQARIIPAPKFEVKR